MDDFEQTTRVTIRRLVKERGTAAMKWGIFGLLGHFLFRFSHWLTGSPSNVGRAQAWVEIPAAAFVCTNGLEIAIKVVGAYIDEFRARSIRLSGQIQKLEEEIRTTSEKVEGVEGGGEGLAG